MRSSKSDLIPIYTANFLKGPEVRLRFRSPLPPPSRACICISPPLASPGRCVSACARARGACVWYYRQGRGGGAGEKGALPVVREEGGWGEKRRGLRSPGCCLTGRVAISQLREGGGMRALAEAAAGPRGHDLPWSPGGITRPLAQPRRGACGVKGCHRSSHGEAPGQRRVSLHLVEKRPVPRGGTCARESSPASMQPSPQQCRQEAGDLRRPQERLAPATAAPPRPHVWWRCRKPFLDQENGRRGATRPENMVDGSLFKKSVDIHY